MNFMRSLIQLCETAPQSSREFFLETLDMWCGELHNDEFESNKSQIEAELFQCEDWAAHYRAVNAPALLRGTGLTNQQVTILKRGGPVDLHMAESALTSWTTNPQVAQGFAVRVFRHFDGDYAAVIRIPANELPVFLDVGDVWSQMTRAERKAYPGIGLGAQEGEIIVRHTDHIKLDNSRIAMILNREDHQDEDEEDW